MIALATIAFNLAMSSVASSLNNAELAAVVAPWVSDMNDPEIAFRSGGHTALFGTKHDADGPFPYGSVTKCFTAIVTFRLAEEGKLQLHDKASSFGIVLPKHERVTIGELLNHTSGLTDYFYGFQPSQEANPDAIDRVIQGLASKSGLREGSFFYSNTNYYLLGKICARATHSTLSNLYRRYIFEPLHLHIAPNRLPSFDLRWYGGAGELAGSIDDLAVFGSAVAAHDPRLLGASSWARFGDKSAPMPDAANQWYAAGLIAGNLSVYPTLSHGGTIPANQGVDPFASMLIVRPKTASHQAFAVFKRKDWGPRDLNATYGAFAACCAAADTKGWLQEFSNGVSSPKLAALIRQGMVAAGFQAPSIRLGNVQSFTARYQMVRPGKITIEGVARGGVGTVNVQAAYGPNGQLQSLQAPD